MSHGHRHKAPERVRKAEIIRAEFRARTSMLKITFAFALLIAIVISISSVVFANSPGVAGSVTVTVEPLPANIAYVDLMVKFDKANHLYTKCNDWVTKEAGLLENSDLVRYASDGYQSYAAHAKGAEPLMNLLEGTPVNTFTSRFWNNRLQSMKDMFPFIKIALFDASGTLVHISSAIDVNPFIKSFDGRITLDGKTGQLSVYNSFYLFGIILYLIGYLLIPWAITVVTETGIGVIFRIRPAEYVFLINSISNLTMNGLIFLTLLVVNRVFLPIPILIAIEIGVVICEYLAYLRKYTTISNQRLLAFSITANASSLMIGLIFNSLLWNVWDL